MDWGPDPDGATPLTDDQRTGLKLSWVASRTDLNEAEGDNILVGVTKWQRRRPRLADLLDDQVVRDLHRDLFGQVWSWAGTYRRRELNLGIEARRVPTAVRDLTADAAYWFADDAAMPVDEAAARFHHRLVEIHPFPNGNGRHARALTDLILVAAGTSPFAWGGRDLGPISSIRRAYVDALRAADRGDYDALLRFLRS